MRPHYGGLVCQVLGEHDSLQLEGDMTDDANIYSSKSQGSAAFHAVGVSSPCRCQQACCHTVFTNLCTTTRLETRLGRNCNETVKTYVTYEVFSESSWSIHAASL
jgi:hypothetical protein